MRKKDDHCFQYFQPNPVDLKDSYGDCAVRAIALAEKKGWLESFDLLTENARAVYCPFTSKVGFEKTLRTLRYTYTGITNRKGTIRPTVREFAATHPTGIYILVLANHYVAVKNGKYWDTWDSGDKKLYGYWKKPDA